MRVVSQDGMIDVNYDNVVIATHSIDGKSVIAKSMGDYYNLAEYSSEEKAKKAMKMLREQFKIEQAYKMLYSLFEFKRTNTKILDDVRENLFGSAKESFVFQFPKDGEVKV